MFMRSRRAILATSLAWAAACSSNPSTAPATPPTAGATVPIGTAGVAAPSAGAKAPSAGQGTSTSGLSMAGAKAPSAGSTAMTTAGTSGTGMTTSQATAGASGSATPAAGSGMNAAGSGAAGSGSSSTGAGFPQLPKVTTTDGPGPFSEVVKVKNTPPGGWMIYPKDIGRDGIKHPLFIFGPGGGTTPDTYEQMGMHWDRYGSYGFVIYVLPMSTGDGAAMKSGLDWLIKQNDDMTSPLYQHLDTSHVCAAGHSEGSITVFAFMPDDRVTTTVHISGGSFDGMGSSKLRKDTMFLCGPDGNADIAEPQCETDFMNTKVPTFYTKIQGATHITSGRMGWAATIAWMLWHLAGQEDQWKKEFLEPTGQFQMGIYKSQTKNWQ
jgi:hypothetical protein